MERREERGERGLGYLNTIQGYVLRCKGNAAAKDL